jgi:hypothetical protein
MRFGISAKQAQPDLLHTQLGELPGGLGVDELAVRGYVDRESEASGLPQERPELRMQQRLTARETYAHTAH